MVIAARTVGSAALELRHLHDTVAGPPRLPGSYSSIQLLLGRRQRFKVFDLPDALTEPLGPVAAVQFMVLHPVVAKSRGWK